MVLLTDDGCYYYDVTYIVNNGKEIGVADRFIKPVNLESGRRRMQGRCKYCGSFIRDCGHDQFGPNPFLMQKNNHSEDELEPELLALLASFEHHHTDSIASGQHVRIDSEQPNNAKNRSPIPSTSQSGRKRKLEEKGGSKRSIKRHQSIEYDDTILFDPDGRSAVDESLKTLSNVEIVNDSNISTNTDEVESALAVQSGPFANDEEMHPIENSKIEAKQLHKSIFLNCLELENLEDDGTAFIADNDSRANQFMRQDFQNLIKKISKLSQDVAFDLLRLSYNFIMNMIKKFEDVTKQRESISEKWWKSKNHLHGALDDIAYDLAAKIVDIDDQQEKIFRQIERAGFDVFTKAEQRIKHTFKEFPNKNMRRQISLLSLKINEISMSWSSELKSSRSEIELLADSFYDGYGVSVEDVVDGVFSDAAVSSISADINDAGVDIDEERNSITVADTDTLKLAKIRDPAEAAATIVRRSAKLGHSLDSDVDSVENRTDLDGLLGASVVIKDFRKNYSREINNPENFYNKYVRLSEGTSYDSSFAVDHEWQFDEDQKVSISHKREILQSKVQLQRKEIRNKARSKSSAEKIAEEFADFIDSEDEMIILSQYYSSYRKRRVNRPYKLLDNFPHEQPNRSRESLNRSNIDFESGNSHEKKKQSSNAMNAGNFETSFRHNVIDPSVNEVRKFEKGKFYHRVSPKLNARYDGRIVVIEGDKLMDNQFNLSSTIDINNDTSHDFESGVQPAPLLTDVLFDEEIEKCFARERTGLMEEASSTTQNFEINDLDRMGGIMTSMWRAVDDLWTYPSNNYFSTCNYQNFPNFENINDESNVLDIFEQYWNAATGRVDSDSSFSNSIKQFATLISNDVKQQLQEAWQFLFELKNLEYQVLSIVDKTTKKIESVKLQESWQIYKKLTFRNMKLIRLISCEELRIWIGVKMKFADSCIKTVEQSSSDSLECYNIYISLVLKTLSNIEQQFFNGNGIISTSGMFGLLTANSQADKYLEQIKVLYLCFVTIKLQWSTRQIRHSVDYGTDSMKRSKCLAIIDQLLDSVISSYGVLNEIVVKNTLCMMSMISSCLEFNNSSPCNDIASVVGISEDKIMWSIHYQLWLNMSSAMHVYLVFVRCNVMVEYFSDKIAEHRLLQPLGEILVQKNILFVGAKCWDRINWYLSNFGPISSCSSSHTSHPFFRDFSVANGGVCHQYASLKVVSTGESSQDLFERYEFLKDVDLWNMCEVNRGGASLENIWALLTLQTKVLITKPSTINSSRIMNNWSLLKSYSFEIINKICTNAVIKSADGEIINMKSNLPWFASRDAQKVMSLFSRHFSRLASIASIWDSVFDGFEIIISSFLDLVPLIGGFKYRVGDDVLVENDHSDDDLIVTERGLLTSIVLVGKHCYPSMDMRSIVVSLFKSHELLKSSFHRLKQKSSDDDIPFVITCSNFLHQHLFAILSMAFVSMEVINPLLIDLQGCFETQGTSKKVPYESYNGSIHFLSHLRFVLHSFLSHSVMENCYSDDSKQSSGKKFSLTQYRRLKSQVGSSISRKRLLDIFRLYPSFSTGSLLCLITKELACLFTNQVVQDDWKMGRELMDLFIDTNLFPKLPPATTNHASSAIFESDKDRSCLMLLLTLWTFNPYPIKIQLSTPATSKDSLSFAKNEIVPLRVTNHEFIIISKQLWKEDEEGFLSVAPFLQVVRLIQTIHSNAIQDVNISTTIVENLIYTGISSLNALLSHWIIITNQTSTNIDGSDNSSVLKLHLFPKDIIKALLSLLKIQNHEIDQKINAPSATNRGNKNTSKLNLEISSIISYSIHTISSSLLQYIIQVLIPVVFYLQKGAVSSNVNLETLVRNRNSDHDHIAESVEERRELHQCLLSFYQVAMGAFEDTLEEALSFAPNLRIILLVALNRCRPNDKDFSFDASSRNVNSNKGCYDFSPVSFQDEVQARGHLKFLTCQNLSHVVLETLVNFHQVLQAKYTIFQSSPYYQQNRMTVNPQEFFTSFHHILQKLIDRHESNSGMYALEFWMWQKYFERWQHFSGEGERCIDSNAIIFKSTEINIFSTMDKFISHNLQRIFLVQLAARLIFRSKFRLFTICVDHMDPNAVSCSTISQELQTKSLVLQQYAKLSPTLQMDNNRTFSLDTLLLLSWYNEDCLQFNLLGMEFQLNAFYRNSLQKLSQIDESVRPSIFQQLNKYVDKLHKVMIDVINFLRLSSFHGGSNGDPLIDQQILRLMKLFVQFSAYPTTRFRNMQGPLLSLDIVNIYFRDYLSVSIRQLCNSLRDMLNPSTLSLGQTEIIEFASRRRVDLNQYLINLLIHIRLASMTRFSTMCLEWVVILHPILVASFHQVALLSSYSEALSEASHCSSHGNFNNQKRISRLSVEKAMELVEELLIQFILSATFPSLHSSSPAESEMLKTAVINIPQRVTDSSYFFDELHYKNGPIVSESERNDQLKRRMILWERCISRNEYISKETLEKWKHMQGEEREYNSDVFTTNSTSWPTHNQTDFIKYITYSPSPNQLSVPIKRAIAALQQQNLIPITSTSADEVAFSLMKRLREYYELIDDTVTMYSVSWDD